MTELEDVGKAIDILDGYCTAHVCDRCEIEEACVESNVPALVSLVRKCIGVTDDE